MKSLLKSLQEQLKGITLQVVTPVSVTPYTSLSQFGQAILAEEANGNTVYVSQVWTSTGVVVIENELHFAKVMKQETVNAIQFVSKQPSASLLQFLGTND